MFRIFLLVLVAGVLGTTNATATIVWGPVMGATSSSSITIAFKAKLQQKEFVVILSDAKGERITVQPVHAYSETVTGTLHKFKLEGLQANTQYSFTIYNTEDTLSGSFKTFPETGSKHPFSFTFGSCNENYENQGIFSVMEKQNPLFFLHLGDWTYPDHEVYPEHKPGGKNRLYSAQYNEALAAYDVRCTLPYMRNFMQHTPMDFIYDDDDMTIDGCSRTTYTELSMVGNVCEMSELPMPDSVRMNTINAYYASFPHYDMPHAKTEGAYHSFRCGNVEIFFVDTRANRSPDTEIFKPRKKGKWKMKVDATHSNLGEEQYQWLLNGLKNSTADWKIIASGTNFNIGYKKVLDLSMVLQSYMLPNGLNGAFVAAMLSSTWSGYPFQQRGIVNFCHKNKIQNVAVISGDAHTAAIDDGKNSGLPECMSGNLAVENTKQLDYVHNMLQFDIWNKGGQGLGNTNYENTMGKIEVFGADSLRMNVVDGKGKLLTTYTLLPGNIPCHYSMRQGTKVTAAAKLRSIGYIFRILKKRKQDKKAEAAKTK